MFRFTEFFPTFTTVFGFYMIFFLIITLSAFATEVKWGLFAIPAFLPLVPMTIFAAIVNVNTTECTESHKDVIIDREICTVANGSQIYDEGHFYRRTGTFVVASADTYRYYYQEGQGYRQDGVPADKTEIRYLDSENDTPRVVGYHEYVKKLYKFRDSLKEGDVHEEKTYYIIYVPEGSIIESFMFQ